MDLYRRLCGCQYNRVINISDIRFLLGNGKNHFEASKLQYTMDGREWQDIELTGMDNAFTGVQGQYLEVKINEENLPEDFQAMGIRLVATADNKLDAYLNVHEIQINKNAAQQPEEQERYTGTVTYSGMSVRNGAGETNYFDGSNSTEVQLAKGPYEDPNRGNYRKGVDTYRYIRRTEDGRIFQTCSGCFRCGGCICQCRCGIPA